VERIEITLFLKVSYCSINALVSRRDLYEELTAKWKLT
jgi:hypothetical protein